MKLSLAAKFNLVFLVIFIAGLGAAAVIAKRLLQQNAREETVQSARLLLESALASRTYTSGQIAPLLRKQLRTDFLPQTIPSYAATENLHALLRKYPDFGYKEAALNPTNLRDRASDWEADIIHQLRGKPELREMVGERDTPTGRALYIAWPIQITDPACLSCHTTPEMAPKTVTAVYGTANGFGWKLDEIIGAQVVSVPMAVPKARADAVFNTFMLSLLGVFGFLFIALNAMVHIFVTRRIVRLSALADQVSMGKFDAGEFDTAGSDELSALARSFGRMRTSLASAMKMLDD